MKARLLALFIFAALWVGIGLEVGWAYVRAIESGMR